MWMEVRCTVMTDNNETFYDSCLSKHNAGPSGMCDDTQQKVLSMFRDLSKEAAAQGWKKIKKEWVCPFCAKNMTKAK